MLTLGAPVIDAQGNNAVIISVNDAVGLRGHRGRHLQHGGVALHLEEPRHLHGTGLRDAAQIIADHIDDHHILGAILF